MFRSEIFNIHGKVVLNRSWCCNGILKENVLKDTWTFPSFASPLRRACELVCASRSCNYPAGSYRAGSFGFLVKIVPHGMCLLSVWWALASLSASFRSTKCSVDLEGKTLGAQREGKKKDSVASLDRTPDYWLFNLWASVFVFVFLNWRCFWMALKMWTGSDELNSWWHERPPIKLMTEVNVLYSSRASPLTTFLLWRWAVKCYTSANEGCFTPSIPSLLFPRHWKGTFGSNYLYSSWHAIV